MQKITPDYLSSQGLSPFTPKRFFAKVWPTESCWIWIGKKNSKGYGKLNALNNKKQKTAHRISWILHFGTIPKGMMVLHDCPGGDNPACVNPAHLWLGRALENARDASRKNRTTFGERDAAHKLTLPEVRAIRRLAISGADAARIFNVSKGAISMIRNGLRWNHPALIG